MGCIVHQIPGRLRIKIPSLKRQPDACQKTASFFAGIDGVTDVASNPVTGSLTIHYDPEHADPQQLFDLLRQKKLLSDTADRQQKNPDYGPATKATQALGKALVNWALGKALEANGLSLLAALI